MNIDFSLLENLNTSPGGLGPASPEPVDNLLALQTTKVELLQHRDALATKRLELKENIDRMNLTLAHYKQQHHQYETKQKLESYLQQNDHEYSKLSAPDDGASFVLDNLHVLPSGDWPLRMRLVARFYPHMEIADCTATSIHENGELFTVMGYTVSARGLPALNVRVVIKNETVRRVELGQSEKALLMLQKVSPSYARILETNYRRLGKPDLLMYSYHSLARLRNKRVTVLLEILSEYLGQVTRPSGWQVDPLLALQTVEYVEFAFHQFKVRLYWSLVLENSVLGEVESHLKFVVIRGDGSVLDGTNAVFLGLVQEHGVVRAFRLMVRNMWDASDPSAL